MNTGLIMAQALALAAPGAASASQPQSQPPSLPLPTRTDVPEDRGGVVLCPDRASAETMFSTYIADGKAGSTMINLDLFFAGLQATGCTQGGGPLTVSRVEDRKKLAEGGFIRFIGVRPDGSMVIAIMNEDANNRHPRTALERWLEPRSDDGTLTIDAASARAYRCPSVAAARAVVTAITATDGAAGSGQARQSQALKAALRRQRCTMASGTFTITDVHEVRMIELGFEAVEEWTALSATDAAGRSIGLVYDGSLM